MPSSSNTVLITGVAGYLGSVIAEHFLAAGHRVVGVDNLSYLEMFLHAREWTLSGREDLRIHPVLVSIDHCRSVSDLSRLCGDIAVLIGLVEGTFKTNATETTRR